MTGDDCLARLEAHLVPIERPAPGDADDIKELAETFEGKRVVGLGEATHGTREFFQLKHRLLRLLVTDCDCHVFGLEVNFTEARAVDRYVVSGEGTVEDALSAISFWTTTTEEMRSLIEWLRAYNSGRPDDEKVRIYGFDVQSAAGPAREIRRFLDRVDPAYLADIEAELATLESGLPDGDPDAVTEWLIAAETVALDLQAQFDHHEASYRSLVSETEWQLALRYRRLIEQAGQLVRARTFRDGGDPNGVRDRAMAETVSWILDHEDADTVALWAHNGHVKTGSFLGGEWETPPETMGDHLRERFGEAYYALGFEFGRGSFQAHPDPTTGADRVEEFTLDSVREESVAQTLDRLDEPLFILDFDAANGDPVVRKWLDAERPVHNIGAIYTGDPEAVYAPVELSTAFDGLVFVAETNRAVPLDGA